MKDVLVRSKLSGGTLRYSDLVRYCKDRLVKPYIVDYEVIDVNARSVGNYGVELVSSGDANVVVYNHLNIPADIESLCKDYQFSISETLNYYSRMLIDKYPEYNLTDIKYVKCIGQLIYSLIYHGIVSNIESACEILEGYGLDEKKLFSLLQKYNIQFFIKIKDGVDSIETLESLVHNRGLKGVVVKQNRYSGDLEEFCKKNKLLLIVVSEFSSHVNDVLLTDAVNLSEYVKECLELF